MDPTPMPADAVAARRLRFQELHQSGCFLLPNPWDVGSARFLAAEGFQALATTSSGMAFSQGRPDMGLDLEPMLAGIAALVAATPLPVNADFEDGHAAEPEGLAETVTACVATGVAGLSIEDATGDPAAPLYPFEVAVARFRAARAAVTATGTGVVLTARAEAFLAGHEAPFPEVCRRLEAFAAEGADCLYAPGVTEREQIAQLVRLVAPKPLNLLVSRPIGLTLEEIAGLGVRRVSLGGALARAAWGGFARTVEGLKAGRFEALADAMPHARLQSLFGG